jgi:enoyl-CoA hydratase
VTEPGRQLDRAVAIAERIAAQAPLGVQATLRSARRGILDGEAPAAAHMRDDLPAILASDDFREGLTSFRERRSASFLGK